MLYSGWRLIENHCLSAISGIISVDVDEFKLYLIFARSKSPRIIRFFSFTSRTINFPFDGRRRKMSFSATSSRENVMGRFGKYFLEGLGTT